MQAEGLEKKMIQTRTQVGYMQADSLEQNSTKKYTASMHVGWQCKAKFNENRHALGMLSFLRDMLRLVVRSKIR